MTSQGQALLFIWYLQNILLPFIASFRLMTGLLAFILAVALAATTGVLVRSSINLGQVGT